MLVLNYIEKGCAQGRVEYLVELSFLMTLYTQFFIRCIYL